MRINPLAAAALAVGASLVTATAARPWFMHWGATEAEIDGPWPVDDLVPFRPMVATRAVTIQATPEQIWPWLMQLGQDRGGFYSYTWLENLVGADIHNLDYIEPRYQIRKQWDTVWLARPDKFKGLAVQVIALIEPYRVMALVSAPDAVRLRCGEGARGAWCFMLKPQPDGSTRLIMRSLGEHVANLGFDCVHFIMERKMMLGIKARAERHSSRQEAPLLSPKPIDMEVVAHSQSAR